jgi:hypothetical protein
LAVRRLDGRQLGWKRARCGGRAVRSVPHSDETLASARGNELFWPHTAEAFASAGVLLAVVNAANDPARTLRYARVLTTVTAAAVAAQSGVGVFWSATASSIRPASRPRRRIFATRRRVAVVVLRLFPVGLARQARECNRCGAFVLKRVRVHLSRKHSAFCRAVQRANNKPPQLAQTVRYHVNQ